ncbi:N-acetylglucosamine-6-phosphate deacetylase [Puma concolor]|uniref:N-acetylglucosamine-6-phosphate deacetylase n=1 Tax=Puma concolor TaxID=9696 RepID=A0A6P6HAI4_PUMCO|nr:N-acetylglucosamine-6-phosphate deacetylase [Puma concolor]
MPNPPSAPGTPLVYGFLLLLVSLHKHSQDEGVGQQKVLPQIPVKSGGPHGAGVLGVHLEGPFISREKRGAHPEAHLRSFEANAFHDVLATYGPLDNVRIVTLAPELGRSHEVIQALTARGICVSLGHSVADLQAAEEAVQSGATFITHLFNAMLPVSCSVELALEAASLHPAQLLGLEKHKGTLDFGADADFVVLDDSLHVRATYISGELVWQAEEARQ